MRLKVTAQAQKSMKGIHGYIYKKFGRQAANRYKDAFWHTLLSIMDTPTIRQQYRNPKDGRVVYKYILNRKTVILYTLNEDEMIVEAVYDTRTDCQNP